MVVEVRLFGSPEMRVGAAWVPLPLDKRGGLLAFLAREAAPAQRLRVARLFWPEAAETHARTNLRGLLARIKALDLPTGVQPHDDCISWPVETDTAAFDAAYAKGLWPAAVQSNTAALLKDFSLTDAPAFNGCIDLERRLLEERFRDAVTRLAARLVEEGRAERALALFQRLLERDALDERAVGACVSLAIEVPGLAEVALRIYDTYARHLESELGLTPDPELRALVKRAGREARVPRLEPAASTPERRVHRMPHPVGGRVSRDSDVMHVVETLRKATRAVTLVGPGGIGKSVLAAMVARTAAGMFEDGAVWVALSGLEDASLVPVATGVALGLTEPTRVGVESALLRALRHKKLLLVLDDLDGLYEALPFIGRLLDACEGVKVLATSRRSLPAPLAEAIEVTGLDYPESAEDHHARDYAAVRLFALRARQVRPDFLLEPEVTSRVIEICRLVDGSPLGIELAAGASAVTSLTEIIAFLGRDLGALRSDIRNTQPRHTSLRAAFDHTWDLLRPADRRALSKLTLLHGRFDMETALTVGEADPDVLLTLVDWFLLKRGIDGRFELHPLVRQFAEEALLEDAAAEASARSRHAAYFRGLVESNGRWMRGGAKQRDALEAIGEQLEDVHAAWDFYLHERNHSALLSFVPLLHYYEILGMVELGEARFAETAAAADAKSVLRAKALLAQSMLAGRARMFETCRTTIVECMALLTELGEEDAFAQLHRGVLDWELKDVHSAKRYWLEAVEVARRTGDEWSLAGSLANLGMAALCENELGAARSLCEEAIAIFDSLEDRWGLSICITDLGEIDLALKRNHEALLNFRRGLDLARSIYQWPVVIETLERLASIVEAQGRHAEAAELLAERTRLAREHGLESLLTN